MPAANALLFSCLCQFAAAARPAHYEESLEGQISANGAIIKGHKDTKSIGKTTSGLQPWEGDCSLCMLSLGDEVEKEKISVSWTQSNGHLLVSMDSEVGGFESVHLFCLGELEELTYEERELKNFSSLCPNKYEAVAGHVRMGSMDKYQGHEAGKCIGQDDSRNFFDISHPKRVPRHPDAKWTWSDGTYSYDPDMHRREWENALKSGLEAHHNAIGFAFEFGLSEYTYRLHLCSRVKETNIFPSATEQVYGADEAGIQVHPGVDQ